MVLSLLGLSVKGDAINFYKNNTDLDIKEGEYINSIDVLINSFDSEKFILFGTKEAIEAHKIVFKFGDDVEFVEFDAKNLNDIFLKIMKVLINNSKEEIIFDITHSFRDAVLMSVISTIVSQIIYNPNITMIYAKEIIRFKEYEYEQVGEDILNTSNISMLLATFLDTLKVPNLHSKYSLYEILNEFSTHLLSNQFKDIFENDIKKVRNYININKGDLFFVEPLMEKLDRFITEIEKLTSILNYKKFLYFSKLFLKKRYFLHSASYLIESIGLYLLDAFYKQGFVDFKEESYENIQKIVQLLKFTYEEKNFNFPNEYFIYINYLIIKKFGDLRERVADIRNNLAHINTNKTFEEIEEELRSLIEEFENLISSREIYKMDKSEKNKKYTTKYKLEEFQRDIDKLKRPNTPSAKLTTIIKKYKENKLDTLTNFDTYELTKFLNKNLSKIESIRELEKNKIFLIK